VKEPFILLSLARVTITLSASRARRFVLLGECSEHEKIRLLLSWCADRRIHHRLTGPARRSLLLISSNLLLTRRRLLSIFFALWLHTLNRHTAAKKSKRSNHEDCNSIANQIMFFSVQLNSSSVEIY